MLLNVRAWLWARVASLLWRVHDWAGGAAYRAGDRRFTLNNRVLDRRYGLDEQAPF